MCGRCGRSMKVAYSKPATGMVRYRCVAQRQHAGAPVCQAFGALRLERAVEALVLECLQPLGVEAMLEASDSYVAARASERDHWLQRVERARYEAELARRRYDEVDPSNRLVARELERRLEKALQGVEAMEHEAAQRIESLERPMSATDRERLRRHAQHLPSLWSAPTTRPQDRKRIVRCLIERVVVTVPDSGPNHSAQVYWHGGEVTVIEVPRGRSGIHRHVADSELIDLIRELATEFSDAQIARILIRRRLRTPKGLIFTAHRVALMRNNHAIKPGPRVARRGEDLYTAQQAAEILHVTSSTITRWVEVGLLRGSRATEGAPWRIRVTPEDRMRLAVTEEERGWLPLKGAALALGVSQQTVLQKLKSGELEGRRVQAGRRSAWRIRRPSTTSDDQPELFR